LVASVAAAVVAAAAGAAAAAPVSSGFLSSAFAAFFSLRFLKAALSLPFRLSNAPNAAKRILGQSPVLGRLARGIHRGDALLETRGRCHHRPMARAADLAALDGLARVGGHERPDPTRPILAILAPKNRH
jgi:hypothetical protein